MNESAFYNDFSLLPRVGVVPSLTNCGRSTPLLESFPLTVFILVSSGKEGGGRRNGAIGHGIEAR